MQIQLNPNAGRPKADLAFYTAFMNLTRQRYYGICINFLKALQFVILIPATILKFNGGSDLINCFIWNLVASIIGMVFSLVSIKLIYHNATVFLNVADQTNHSVLEQITNDLSEIQYCYSQRIYVADSNITIEDVNQQTKKLFNNIARNTIIATLKVRFLWYRNVENFYSLVSFSSMIYSIIVLSTISMNTVTEVNLIIYVVIVGLAEFMVLLGFFLLVLSPLICIGLCILCCFCKNKQDQNGKFINIPVKEATLTDIVNAGGNCSICFMDIGEKQKIYVLTCSDKHVFHCDCLRHWAKVKNSCPICRGEIPMTDQQVAPNDQSNQSNRQNENASM